MVATRRHRRQNISEARDCSDIDAVKPPVEMRTVCHRLEGVVIGEVEDPDNVPFGAFSEGGVGYL